MSTEFRAIGRRLRRPDAGPRLTGHEHYTADITLPGMLHAALVLSREASARITGVDPSAALAEPGVVAVVTGSDLPPHLHDDAPVDRGLFLLARERVSYVGQPVAVVLAASEPAAHVAADLVDVTYAPLPPVTDPLAALATGAPAVRPGRTTPDGASPNVNGRVHFTRGDVDAAFRDAAVVVERAIRSHAVHQSYLEPRAVVAAADPLGAVTVYTPTQGQFVIRAAVAQALRLPETSVRVQPLAVGGGFGGKFVLLEPLAAWLALRTGRPVRLVLTRAQDFVATTPAPEAAITVALAADAEGRLTGLRAELIFDTGFFAHAPYELGGLMTGSWYRVPSIDVTSIEVLTHRAGAGAYRAPGLPQVAFALEVAVDEVAARLGLSPLELRRRNAAGGSDPMADGAPWPPLETRRLLHAAAEHPLWTAPRRPGEGVGIALGAMRGGIEPAAASLKLEPDGTLSVIVGSVDLTGTTTGLTQIAAEAFGIAPERIRVVTAPTDAAPHAGRTGGSKILYTVGNAVIAAARDARQQVLAIAADELEAGAADLELVDDRVVVRGAPDRALTLAELHARTAAMGSRHAPIFGRGTVANPEKAPTSAVHIVRLVVDADTGVVRITGYAALQDVGRAINPAEVEGQMHGAVAQGIGWALSEGLVYDAEGQLLTGSWLDYAIPHAADVPAIDTRIHEYPAPHGPFGAKGVGEVPVVPPTAAIANAIADATGLRLTELPMTPERIWRESRRNR